ncbi:MAG: hypothetical protein GYA51_10130 [Candidatus Methanofastidiosa archaeon]|nr:hypothetical protein [Candidatus Methanofastidiosa archaeon]
MADEIKEIIKDLLNDRNLFFYYHGAKLFEKEEMDNLKIKYKTDQNQFQSMIEDKMKQLEEEIKIKKQEMRNTHNNRHKRQIENFITNRERCKKLARSLIDKNSDFPFLIERTLDYLDDFGILSCGLNNTTLDDIRKVMEETNLQITEEYILYKIEKERNQKKKNSLRNLLGHVERLYALNLSVDERAFIVGKLISFSELPKVMVNE